MVKCVCSEFAIVDGFYSINHFDQVEERINNLLKERKVSEIPVKKPVSIVKLRERWIKCKCGKIWRLVAPEFPFKGVFKPININ